MTLSAVRPAAKTDGETPRASDMATQLTAVQHLKKTTKGSFSHDTELGKINEKSKIISQLNRYIVVKSQKGIQTGFKYLHASKIYSNYLRQYVCP